MFQRFNLLLISTFISSILFSQEGIYKQISEYDNSNKIITITKDSIGIFSIDNLNYPLSLCNDCKIQLLIDSTNNKINIITTGFQSFGYSFELSGKGIILDDGTIKLKITLREYLQNSIYSVVIHTYEKVK